MKYLFCGFFLSMLFFSLQVYGQTVIREQIIVPDSVHVLKVMKVYDCKEKIDSGSVIKSQYNVKGVDGVKTYQITNEWKIAKDSTMQILIEKAVDLFPNTYGKASLRPDADDPSVVHINYWLNEKQAIKPGSVLTIKKRTLLCNDSVKELVDTIYTYQGKKDSIVWLYRIATSNVSVFNTKWFKYANIVIEVKEPGSQYVNYLLVNMYDREADYKMVLANRELISLARKRWEVGPLVIPVKYRFGFKKRDNTSKSEVSSDLNIGALFAKRIGKYKKRYETGSLVEVNGVNFSWGPFINLGTETIDTTTTNVGKKPISKGESNKIAVVSVGGSAGINLCNVQLGIFVGWDFGLGPNAKNWNVNVKPYIPWIGLGLSYNVNGMFKKE